MLLGKLYADQDGNRISLVCGTRKSCIIRARALDMGSARTEGTTGSWIVEELGEGRSEFETLKECETRAEALDWMLNLSIGYGF